MSTISQTELDVWGHGDIAAYEMLFFSTSDFLGGKGCMLIRLKNKDTISRKFQGKKEVDNLI